MLFQSEVPKDFVKNILRKFRINHDAELIPTDKKPNASAMQDGDMIINLLPNGNVLAVLKIHMHPTFSPAYNLYHRLTLIDNKFYDEETTKFTIATKGMSSKGNFFRISNSKMQFSINVYRDEKPTVEEIDDCITTDPLAGCSLGIYTYMNEVFMPRMREQMETMVDDIYANLRKLSNHRRYHGARTEQEQALLEAEAIERIAKDGFTKETMEEFLILYGKKHNGFASTPRNQAELQKLLKNEPNAKAKWAKIVLDRAKMHHNEVKTMRYARVMETLKQESEYDEYIA